MPEESCPPTHCKVRLDRLRIHAAFNLPPTDAQVGYQLFDSETDNLIVDGPRAPASGRVEMAVDLPPEPGRYTIFIFPHS